MLCEKRLDSIPYGRDFDKGAWDRLHNRVRMDNDTDRYGEIDVIQSKSETSRGV